HFEALVAFRERFWAWQDKTDFGLWRYLHFLALACLAIAALKGREHLLLADWARPVIVVGRNSLPVFLLSMGLARVAGMGLDALGRDALSLFVVNGSGLGVVIGFAYWCSMLKRQPWKRQAVPAGPAG